MVETRPWCWHRITAVVRSVNEVEHEETPVKDVVEEFAPVTSASSPVRVGDVSVGTSCDVGTVQCDDHVSPTLLDDSKPPAVAEMFRPTFQDRGMPCASSEEMSAVNSLPVSSKSEDSHSPAGLVAFCQSDSSAFTSFITAKHASSPVVVPGCDQRLRDASNANHSSSRCQTRNSTPDYDNPAARLSSSEVDFDQPYCGSDEASQTSAESPVIICVKDSSYEQNDMTSYAVCESFAAGESAVYDNSTNIPDGCTEGVMAPYPPCFPVPVSAFPPCPPCYYPLMPGMTYPYQPAGPAYVNPATSCYSSGVSIIQHCQYPMHPVMPPSGMMPPVGMVPMAYPSLPPYCPSCYPPFPTPTRCCHPYPVPAAFQPYPTASPYWVPPSGMCRPILPLLPPPPMQPEPPWWCWLVLLFRKHSIHIRFVAYVTLDFYCDFLT